MIYKKFTNTGKPKFVDEKERTIIHYISTNTPDRYGEVVHPEGMEDGDFRKNPVVLFAHNSNGPVVGKNLWLSKDKFGVLAKTQFADTELGRDIFRLNVEGYLNAWSIGFIVPKSGSEYVDGFNHIKKWQLLEYSSVPIPANPDCINLIMKSIVDEELKNYLKNHFFKNKTEEKTKMETQKIMLVEQEGKDIPAESVQLNTENSTVNDTRNFIRSIAYKNPGLMPSKFKSSFLNEGTSSDGGATVPTELYNKIMEMVFSQSIMKKYATVFQTTHKDLSIPKLTGVPAFSFVNEGALKAVSNPSFSRVLMSRHDGGFIVLISKQLLEDSAFDLQTHISELASKVIANTIDEAGIKGISPIVGIMDSSSGCTAIPIGEDPTNITFDHILDAIAAVPSETLPDARFIMHRSVWAHLKKLKYSTNGEFIITPDDRKAMYLEGYPVILTDQSYGITEVTGIHGYIAFGDFKNILLNIRKDLNVSVSDSATVNIEGSQLNLWQQGLIGLNFGISFDIKAIFPEAISVITTSN